MYYELIVKICNYMWIDRMLCIVWSDDEPVMIPVLFLFLQIRQEKPYYVADPEVDSLVSIIFKHPDIFKTFDFIYKLIIFAHAEILQQNSI